MMTFLRSLTALLASTSSENIPSTPCTRICRYNAEFFDGQVCIGCFRETYEISQWSSNMSNMERSYVLLDAADRVDSAFEGSISKEELMRQASAWMSQE
jgi:predicted Fe-S protein YdhL (DUF1289 family)